MRSDRKIESGSLNMEIIPGFRIKRGRDRIIRDRLKPRIWRWDYLSLDPILREISIFSSQFKKKSAKILDLGCGVKPYQRIFGWADGYVGVDVDLESGADVTANNWELPFPESSHDLIIATQSLEHTEMLAEAVEEMHRVLKDRGAVFASVPFAFPEHEIPHDYHRFSRYGLRKIFKKFEIIKIVPLNGYAGTLFGLLNNLLHYVPGSRWLFPPIFLLNNALALGADRLAAGTAWVGEKAFGSSVVRELYENYYLGMPLNYVLVARKRDGVAAEGRNAQDVV